MSDHPGPLAGPPAAALQAQPPTDRDHRVGPADSSDLAAPVEVGDPSDLADTAAWLRLAHTDGIGPVRGRALLTRFGPPATLFDASAADLAETLGSVALATALLRSDPRRDATVAAALAWQATDPQTRALIPLGDGRYPARLLDLADPPLLLYCRGDWHRLADEQVAIVGSRNATAIGHRTASGLAAALAERGLAVTSGLAEGIDEAAHRGALAGGGVTLAVVGCGIDRVYPTRHRALAAEIAARGAIVGELPPGMEPLAGHFPRRNRLIAALARAVVVVEAAVRSGSLITARCAADLGREVLAVPGSIHSPLARGCHALLKDGAGLVETADDIFAALGPWRPNRVRSLPAPSEPQGPSESANPSGASVSSGPVRASRSSGRHAPDARGPAGPAAVLLASIAADPVGVDSLVRHHGLPLATVLAALQRLELDGCVRRQNDGSYVRVG